MSERELATNCVNCGGFRIWKKATKDGRMWRQYCSPCHTSKSYESRRKRAAAYNAQIAERRRTDWGFRAYELWHGAKSRASNRKIEFSISRYFIESAIKIGHCAVTGMPFDLSLKDKRMGSFSPSIDRIDPRLGYVDGNVQVVCWIYNRAKGDGTHLDVLKLMEALNAINIRQAA